MLSLSLGNAIDLLSWIPDDKRFHIGSSYILTDILHDKLKMTWQDTFVMIGIIGFSKGLLDGYFGGEPDLKDFIANYVGFGLNFAVNF